MRDAVAAGGWRMGVLSRIGDRPHRLAEYGFLYAVACEKFVKFGFTYGDPRKRVVAMQVGNPFELRFVAAVPHCFITEEQAHESLQAAWQRGEWFRRGPEVEALITEMKAIMARERGVQKRGRALLKRVRRRLPDRKAGR